MYALARNCSLALKTTCSSCEKMCAKCSLRNHAPWHSVNGTCLRGDRTTVGDDREQSLRTNARQRGLCRARKLNRQKRCERSVQSRALEDGCGGPRGQKRREVAIHTRGAWQEWLTVDAHEQQHKITFQSTNRGVTGESPKTVSERF